MADDKNDNAEEQRTETASTADDELDDKAKARIEELTREATKARRELRAAQQVTDQTRRELEQLRVEHESEQEKAIREAVEEAKSDLAAEYRRERLETRLTAAAAGKLHDPADAARHLDLDALLKQDERDLDYDKLIADLAKDKSYLAVEENGGTSSRAGVATQGARQQLTREQAASAGDADAWLRSRRRR